MHRRIVLLVVGALVACSASDEKNDRVAACIASGGRWDDSGCGDGQCQRPGMGATMDDDVDAMSSGSP